MNTTFTELRAAAVPIKRACVLVGRARATHYRHVRGPVHGVDAVDHPLPGPQRAPQFVQDDEVVPTGFQPGVGEDVGDVDRPEPVRRR